MVPGNHDDRNHLRDAFAEYSNPFVSIDVLLTYGTSRFTHVTVRQDARLAGTSRAKVALFSSAGSTRIPTLATKPKLVTAAA